MVSKTEMEKREAAQKSKTVMIVSMIIVIAFVLAGAIFPDGTGNVISMVNAFLCDDLGWSYLLMVAFFVFFGVFIACSKYGKVVLGKDGEKPEFSNFQWFALLFGGGIGIGLVFWSVAEPMMHYATGPMDDPYTQEAMRTALRITFMHEGIHCWALFAVCGTSLAYFQYRKGLPFLISSAFYPLIGDKIYGPIGKVIDILAVFATVFGISTSLGLGALQITGGINYIWGADTNIVWTAVIIGVITAIFTVATVSGLHKWMSKVVNIKVWLSIFFMIFLLVFGGFVFIMQQMTDQLGVVVNNFFTQTFWYGNPEWLSSWTVFYWAWWIAWAPFCGQFFARVSKGRTVRQLLIGGTLLPAGFSFIWIAIYGSAAFNIDSLSGGLISAAVNVDYTTALYALLEQLPLYQIMAPLALVLVVLCFVGAADSATFVLPMLTMGGSMNPPKKARAFWGVAQGAVTIVVILTGGQAVLKSLQTASVASAFPFMFVLLGMCFGLYRALKAEFNPELANKPLFDREEMKRRKEERKAAIKAAAEEEAKAE